ncbi:DUF6417 family protein [Streptomyces sp. NPDC102467]|uniref:DUF6417 family protein n=1 Tax=Streptomyces sp. NPDC102467 TaxID=3366179 RepID=UPI00382D0274
MGRTEGHVALLQRVAETQRRPDGWATASPGVDARAASRLVRLGLARMATGEDQAGLATRTGQSVAWAVQLTADGWDALLYAHVRAAPAAAEVPEPGLQMVALRRSNLDVLKRFVALSGRLHRGPARGLEAAVDTARFHAASNRWIMHVDGEQMRSIARAFFLERIGGSAAPANRFARVYGVTHPPHPLPFEPASPGDEPG